MKIQFKLLPIIAAALFLFGSCDKFFEVDDRARITEELVLSKDADVTAMWAYLYYNLENGFEYFGASVLQANATDEADYMQPTNGVQSYNLGSWNALNNPDGGAYSKFYSGIRNANKFLTEVDSMKNPRFTYSEYKIVDPFRYHQYIRELKAYRMDAKFFKAYCHFELWKRFGEIPIVDKLLEKDEALALERASTAEIIEYIIDLVDEILPEFAELETMTNTEYKNGKWSDQFLGRLTKGAVLAFKARVLLYAASPLNTATGEYDQALCDQAAQVAAEVINLGQYSTNISYRDLQFNRNSGNPENILDFRVGISNNNSMEQWNYPKGGNVQYMRPEYGNNATCPSQNLVDAYETTDGSVMDWTAPDYSKLDPRFVASIIRNGETFNGATVNIYEGGEAGPMGAQNRTTTGYYLKKFVTENIRIPEGVTTPHVWYIFRYGELLLNYAEAMFYANGEDGNATSNYVTNGADLSALDAVNLIRSRTGVGMPALADLTEESLRNERRVELAFEGHRFWDVRRWLIAEDTENADLMGMRATQAGTYTKVKVEDRSFETQMYRYPIPYKEMALYSSWTQNEGWPF